MFGLLKVNPTEHKFASIPQFLEITLGYSSDIGWIFRGQDNIEWPLLPKAGRPEYHIKANKIWAERGQVSGDLARFGVWREEAISVSETLPQNDFDCLAFAQHYGLATRLLDWTTNSLVALFFAVEKMGEKDGAVFCHFPWFQVDRKTAVLGQQFPRVVRLTPPPFDRRIVAQSGVFTYHHDPSKPLRPQEIDKQAHPLTGMDLVIIRLPAAAKRILKRQLSEIGLTRKLLFPDLEGVSAHINWQTQRIVQYAEPIDDSDELL